MSDRQNFPRRNAQGAKTEAMNVTIPRPLIEKIDRFAKARNLTRSRALTEVLEGVFGEECGDE